ncbi:hypothetical protein D9615_001549 [Tricholomella constricta]|uniref:C3H1-type domain-containing protein n=1 Tax=Tricholomella constricta TaxID=117010 RepID=A0A8H5MAK9_9AGAR|nr:hypothetical protein D9615_001549 [Tricholomella constricta]
MDLPAPAWRVKTRPCPFYQKGRCLFEDSCNFMHAVSVKSSAAVTPEPAQPSPETPMKPPLVTIHSPRSVLSPSRSPRLSGLLLALKDVIGEDPDDEYDAMDGSTYVAEDLSGSGTPGKHTVVSTNHSLQTSTEEERNTVESSGSFQTATSGPLPDDDDETLRLPLPSNEPEAQSSLRTIESSPDVGEAPAHPQAPSDLLSPVDLSHLHLGLFAQDGIEAATHDNDSIDSGYADTWKPPFLVTRSPPHSPLKSAFGLLSSPFATASSRVISPRLSAFISGPPQSPFSPAVPADDDDPSDISLDSPAVHTFDDTEEAEPSEAYVVVDESEEDYYAYSPVEDVEDVIQNTETKVQDVGQGDIYVQDEEDEHGQNEEDEHGQDEEDEHRQDEEAEHQDEEVEHRQDEEAEHRQVEEDEHRQIEEQDDEDDTTGGNTSAASWDHHGDPTAVYVGLPEVTSDDVCIAMQRASRTPTHFLTDVLDFNEDEIIASSSIAMPGPDDSFHSESLGPSRPVGDGFGDDEDEPYASPSLFDSAPDDSFISEYLDLPDPVDEDESTAGSSVAISAHVDSSFSKSLDLRSPLDDGFGDDEDEPCAGSSILDSAPKDSFISEYLDLPDPVDEDESTAGSSVAISAHVDSSFSESLDPRSPLDDGFGDDEDEPCADSSILDSAPKDSFISEYLDLPDPVDEDESTAGSSVAISAHVDSSFSESLDPRSPLDDGFGGDEDEPYAGSSILDSAPKDSFISEYLDLPDPVDEDESTAGSSVAISAPVDSLLSESLGPRSPVDDGFGGGDITMDYTAELAYLSSPTPVVNENDTLHSLYDRYSDFTEGTHSDIPEETGEDFATSLIMTDIGSPSEHSSCDAVEDEPSSAITPSKSGFLRERVFTPPPTTTRARSGTVIVPADSPHSGPSPPVPFSAPLRGRASPHSQSARSAWSPDSAVSEVQELPVVSKRIPFGFRNSFASSGRARSSTLASQRSSRRGSRAVEPLPLSTSQSEGNSSPDNSSSTSSVTGGLRPLRLSRILGPQPSSAPSRNSTFSVNSYRQSGNSHRASISSISVLSDHSYSRNPLLLSALSSNIPDHIRNIQPSPDDVIPSPLSSYHLRRLANFDSPRSAPLSRPPSWHSNPVDDTNDVTQTTYHDDRPFSRISEPSFVHNEEQEDSTNYDYTIRRAIPEVPHSAPINRPVSAMRPPMYAIATPKPTLMFAIASDDVRQVRQVLESGDAGPNDAVGPQSALAFALTNDQLNNKMEIVKTLLAFGADPKLVVQHARETSSPSPQKAEPPEDGGKASAAKLSLMDAIDPATRYYVEKADAPHTRRTSALIHRSFFRPLTRVRYELIGQDRALEQLFKDLSMHSRQLSVTPIVVLLCGPSGHGKSLLARKFGSLLDVPTHTVDMTTIHSAQDLWKSYSMSPYDPPSTRSLAEFLIDNEGKRCVVVLDEIEKTHGESPLWALLMPWEHGRCTFEAHGRLVDVRNVVWLGTSNIGQELVFEHHSARALPDQLMSREEYTELMGLLRPRVSERLGASMLSRVTTALPFVPFTPEERRAICHEALHTIAGDIIRTLTSDIVDFMVEGALANYTAAEGARSLYRAVSNQLVDNI